MKKKSSDFIPTLDNHLKQSKSCVNITKKFLNAIESTTAHGLPNILCTENSFVRLMWLVCFLISSAYCAYSIYKSIVGYFDFNVVTRISDIYENPIEFPAITVCNTNMFGSHEGIEFVRQVLKTNGVDDVQNFNFRPYELSQQTANMRFARLVANSNANEANETIKKQLAWSIFETAAFSQFENYKYDLNNFKWYFHRLYGNCYQFNSGFNITNHPISIKKTSQTGEYDGLSLLLYVGIPDNVNTLAFENGAHIFIHNQSLAPTVTDGIGIQAGTMTNLVLRKVVNANLPIPYNQCYNDLTRPENFESRFYKQALALGYRYRQKDCLDLCWQEYVIKECECATFLKPKMTNATFCLTYEKIRCSLLRSFEISQDKSYLEECLRSCPLECESEKYSWVSSSKSFPIDTFAQVLMNESQTIERFNKMNLTVSIDNLKESYLWIKVYYDDTIYTLITQTPQQQLVDLMSSIGGTLGLYLGMSFLSFVELFELSVELGFLAIKRLSNHRKRIQPKNQIEEINS